MKGRTLGVTSKGDTPLSSTKLSETVREPLRLAGISEPPYILRSYFSSFAQMCRDLPESYREFVMGHGLNDISKVYALNKSMPPEKIDEYHDKLRTKGIKVTRVVSHDDSPMGASLEITPTTFVRSIYFFDPDGICLEFAAWTRELPREGDVKHVPARAKEAAERQRVPEAVK